MILTAVLPAGMACPVGMIMMLTYGVGLIIQIPGQKSFHLFIRAAFRTGIKGDACFRKSGSCTPADTAADQNLDSVVLQKARQSPVAAAIRVHHLRGENGIGIRLIDFELFAVSKMLKYLAIIISYCNFHVYNLHFLFC